MTNIRMNGMHVNATNIVRQKIFLNTKIVILSSFEKKPYTQDTSLHQTRGIKKQELEGFYLIQELSGCSRNHWSGTVKYGAADRCSVALGHVPRVLNAITLLF